MKLARREFLLVSVGLLVGIVTSSTFVKEKGAKEKNRNSPRGKISDEIIWVGKGRLYGKKRRSGIPL